MFTLKEYFIEIDTQPRPPWIVSIWLSIWESGTRLAAYSLKDSSHEQPLCTARVQGWTKKNRRSIVRQCSDNKLVLILHRQESGLRQLFHVTRLYDSEDGHCVGFCEGGFMAQFQKGFGVFLPDRTLFGSVTERPANFWCFKGVGNDRPTLGTVVKEQVDSAAATSKGVRYKVSASDELFQHAMGPLFLLAAAMATVHYDHGWLA
jgi:hypothetical protein